MSPSSLAALFWTISISSFPSCWFVLSRREQYTAFLSPATRPRTRSNRLTKNGEENGWSRFQPMNPNLALYYSTDGNQNKIDTKSDDKQPNANDEIILPVYQTVAEQDPLWYDKFVINVLGADVAEEIGLPPPIPPTSTSTTTTTTEQNAQTEKEIEDTETVISSKVIKSTDSGDQTISSLEKDDANDSSSKLLVDTPAKSDAVADTLPDSIESNVAPPPTSTNTPDDTVVYKDPESNILESVPLSELTSLGYSSDDVLLLQSDVVAVIVSGKVRMPRTGMPPQWQILANQQNASSVQMVSQHRAETLIEESMKDAAVAAVSKSKTSTKQAESRIKRQSKSASKFNSFTKEEVEAAEIKAESLRSLAAGDDVVAYNDSASGSLVAAPLSDFISLGYSKEEVVRLQSDVLDLIIDGQVARPRSDLPPNWQRPGRKDGTASNDIQVLKKGAYDEMISKQGTEAASADSIESQQHEDIKFVEPRKTGVSPPAASIASDPVESTEKRAQPGVEDREANEKQKNNKPLEELVEATASAKPNPEKSDTNASLIDSIEPTVVKSGSGKFGVKKSVEKKSPGVDSTVGIDQDKSNKSGAPTEPVVKREVKQRKPIATGSSNTKDEPSNSIAEQAVVFFDYAKGKKQMVPLSKFVSLGYTAEEVADLQADVLATLLADGTTKPRTGVPPQWRISKAKPGTAKPGDVELLSSSNAEKAMKAEPATRAPYRGAEVSPGNGRRMRNQRASPEPSRRRKAASRSREKQALNADGSKKSIYSVRGGNPPKNRKKRTADPPAPNSFWMDIDTFRDLLRSEAKLRVSIVGDGFSKAIKDESDWRLNLYKDWLWTLDRGIGNPIVPSRRERSVQAPPPRSRSSDKPGPKRRPQRRPRNKP